MDNETNSVDTESIVTKSNLEIIRVRSVDFLRHLEPHLTFSDPRLKKPFIEELAQRMIHQPDALMILVAIQNGQTEREQAGRLVAFMIVHNPGVDFPYISVLQAWSHPDNPASMSDPFIARMVLWALSLDKDYVRAETQRSTAAMYRRFGFEPHSQIVKFDLVSKGFHDLLTKRPREFLKWATSLTQT